MVTPTTQFDQRGTASWRGGRSRSRTTSERSTALRSVFSGTLATRRCCTCDGKRKGYSTRVSSGGHSCSCSTGRRPATTSSATPSSPCSRSTDKTFGCTGFNGFRNALRSRSNGSGFANSQSSRAVNGTDRWNSSRPAGSWCSRGSASTCGSGSAPCTSTRPSTGASN